MRATRLGRLLGLLLTLTHGAAAGETFNIVVNKDGHYRLLFSDLGSGQKGLRSDRLLLKENGRPVHFILNDSDNGWFGPGDSLEFIGRRLPGSNSWFAEDAPANVYRLSTAAATTATAPVATQLNTLEHLEQDSVRVAFPNPIKPPLPVWYWQQLSSLDAEAFSLTMLPGPTPARLRVALQGLSEDKHAPQHGLPQHQVDLLLNGKAVASGIWNGQERHVLEFALQQQLPHDAPWTLSLRVPWRENPGADLPVVDVVLLDWIKLEFPPSATANLNTIASRDGSQRLRIPTQKLRPESVRKTILKPNLMSPANQADYLMITHPDLLEQLTPLAEHHRSRGLNVAVIDLFAIYDQFSGGRESPAGIQAMIHHAYQNWQPPKPRFVLLAGDASWQLRPSADSQRPLVPTLQVLSHGELAASDNGFVTVTGDDWLPDLAIGRLPANDADQLGAMVKKLLVYSKAGAPAQDAAHTTLLAGMEPRFQGVSDRLAEQLHRGGLNTQTLYPGSEHRSDQLDTLSALNQTELLVHFLGHGGRYVWRTGPPDLDSASDLFSIDHLDGLKPRQRLPVVLSMTCSSGPFDHPRADSLAEAFVRLEGRGAIGVIAASWRVTASESFSNNLIHELVQKRRTLGEALMHAKQQEPERALVESYNLLGDPAMMLALPAE